MFDTAIMLTFMEAVKVRTRLRKKGRWNEEAYLREKSQISTLRERLVARDALSEEDKEYLDTWGTSLENFNPVPVVQE